MITAIFLLSIGVVLLFLGIAIGTDYEIGKHGKTEAKGILITFLLSGCFFLGGAVLLDFVI